MSITINYKNNTKAAPDVLLEEEALAYADAENKRGIQDAVAAEAAAVSPAVPIADTEINLPDSVRVASDKVIKEPDIATPDDLAVSAFITEDAAAIKDRQDKEAAPTSAEYALARQVDKARPKNKFTEFLSRTHDTLQALVDGSTEVVSETGRIKAPALKIGKPGNDWVSQNNPQNTEETFGEGDKGLDERVARVLDTFSGRVEPGSNQVSPQFSSAIATAVLAAGANRSFQNENNLNKNALKSVGVTESEIVQIQERKALEEAEFQPGQTARVVQDVLSEFQGIVPEGGATERDMEFFINTYLTSLSKGSNPLVKQVHNKEGDDAGTSTSKLAYFKINPNLKGVIDNAYATRSLLKQRVVREPSTLPQLPVDLKSSKSNRKSSAPRATSAENLKGGNPIPSHAADIYNSLASDGSVSASDRELLKQLDSAIAVYEASLNYLDTLPFHVEPSITSAATQKAVMVKNDLVERFGGNIALPNTTPTANKTTITGGALKGLTVPLYISETQFPTNLFGVSEKGIEFKYSEHPFAKLFDMDSKSLLKRLNATRPSSTVVFKDPADLHLNFFNDEMKDPWTSLADVQASINKIIAAAEINPGIPYGAAVVFDSSGGIDVAPGSSGGVSDSLKAVYQGEMMQWLTTAAEEFMQVGNDKLASVFELAGNVSGPSLYIKHKHNDTNLRAGMTITTVNPQNYVWQRAALTNPEPTIIDRPTFETAQDVDNGAYLVEKFTRKNPEELRNFKAAISRNLFDWLESEPDYNVRAAMFDHFLLNQPIELIAKKFPAIASKVRKYTTHKEYNESLEMARKYRQASKVAFQMARSKLNKEERVEAVSAIGQEYLRLRKGQNPQGQTTDKAIPYDRRGLADFGEASNALLQLSSNLTAEDIQTYADAFGKSKEAPLVDTALIHLGDYIYGVGLGQNRSILYSTVVVEQDGASNNYAYLSGILGIEGLARATRLLAPRVINNADGTWQFEDIRGLANRETRDSFIARAEQVSPELVPVYKEFYDILENDHGLRKDFWKSILMEFGYSRAADSFAGDIAQKFDVDSEKFSAVKDNVDALVKLLSDGMEDALGNALGDTNAYASFMKVGGVIASVLGENVIIRNQINFPILLSQFETMFDQESEFVVSGSNIILNINQPVRTRTQTSTRERLNAAGKPIPNSERYDQASKASVVTIHGADSGTIAQTFKLAQRLQLWGYGVFDAIVADANSAFKFAELYNRIQKEDIKRWSTTPIEDVQSAVSKGVNRLTKGIKDGEPDVGAIATLALNHVIIKEDYLDLEFLQAVESDSNLGKAVLSIRSKLNPFIAVNKTQKSISALEEAHEKLAADLTTIIKAYPGGIARFSQDIVDASFFSVGGHTSIPYSMHLVKDEWKKSVKERKLKTFNEVATQLKSLVKKAQNNAKDVHSQFHKYDGGNLG